MHRCNKQDLKILIKCIKPMFTSKKREFKSKITCRLIVFAVFCIILFA